MTQSLFPFLMSVFLGLPFGPMVRSDVITIVKPLFRSVRFVDEKTGWIAGFAGVFHTDDGGESWQRQQIAMEGTKSIGRAEMEENGLIAWADQDSIIIRVQDILAIGSSRGPSRFMSTPKVPANSYSIVFADRNTGWATSIFGFHRTTDGGNTWSAASARPSKRVAAICPVSSMEFWAVGNRTSVLHSIDGGQSWTSQLLHTGMSQYGGTADLWAVEVLNLNHAWVAGTDGLIFYSGDNGKTWHKQDTPITRFCGLSAISFVDDREGWAVGARYENHRYYAVVLHTSDGGERWESQVEGIEDRLSSVQALAEGRAWAVGIGGTVLRTSDHGKRWIPVKI